MNTHARLAMDKDAFLHWAEAREGRFELKDGTVQMMVGGSRAHARVTMRIANAFSKRVDPMALDVMSSDLAVSIGLDIRFPDVIVEPIASDDRALSTSTPLVIVEVLSPSSLALDMNIKAAEYMSLASLECYVVAAQDEPRLWVWNRSTEANRPWPKQPVEVFGIDQAVPVPCLGLEVPMGEIYLALTPRASG